MVPKERVVSAIIRYIEEDLLPRTTDVANILTLQFASAVLATRPDKMLAKIAEHDIAKMIDLFGENYSVDVDYLREILPKAIRQQVIDVNIPIPFATKTHGFSLGLEAFQRILSYI